MVLGSTTEGTACSTSHGDAFPQNVPLTIVHGSASPTIRFEAGQGATEIRGWIYDVEAPSPSGGPTEEFTLQGTSGTYQPRSIVAGARLSRAAVSRPGFEPGTKGLKVPCSTVELAARGVHQV